MDNFLMNFIQGRWILINNEFRNKDISTQSLPRRPEMGHIKEQTSYKKIMRRVIIFKIEFKISILQIFGKNELVQCFFNILLCSLLGTLNGEMQWQLCANGARGALIGLGLGILESLILLFANLCVILVLFTSLYWKVHSIFSGLVKI